MIGALGLLDDGADETNNGRHVCARYRVQNWRGAWPVRRSQ